MKESFILEIKNCRKELNKEIEKKLEEFKKRNKDEIFLELCFCILVANTSLSHTLKVWKKIGGKFLYLSEKDLRKELKNLGYRFYNKRSKYIVDARKFLKRLVDVLNGEDVNEMRKWLVNNIKGIGWKEASHFLRNLGYKNFAILDRHILRMLKNYGVIKEIPKTLSGNTYLEIEEKLIRLAKELRISPAELDLYIFYLATGKIPER